MNSNLKAYMQNFLARLDALTLRERMLVFGTAAMVLFGIWQVIVMQPLEQRAAAEAQQLEALNSRIGSANETLAAQVMQLEGMGSEGRGQLQRIQQRIDLLDDQLGDYAAELIDPAEMARVLEGVLEEQGQLRLLSMRNLGAEPLAVAGEAGSSMFYKHGLEMELEGTYLACLAYLEAIETLPWKFYWEVLDLNVDDFPYNRIRILVSTLSMDEEWIGA